MLSPGKAAIIYHAQAGRGLAPHLVARLNRRLTASGWQVVESQQTRYAGHAQTKLAPRLAGRVNLIIVMGGDGTLREVAAGLVDSPSPVPIGLVPTGNANVVARDRGIPLQPEPAIGMIPQGRVQRLDIGTLRTGRNGIRPAFFLAMVEIGFGARVVHLAHRLRSGRLKRLYRRWGDLVYGMAAMGALTSSGEIPFQLYRDHSATPQRHVAAVIANTRNYAKGWTLTPDARMDDGMLDWTARSRSSLSVFLRVFMAAAKGKRLPRGLSQFGQGQQFKLRSRTPMTVQADGDPFPSATRLEIGLIPHQLVLVTP